MFANWLVSLFSIGLSLLFFGASFTLVTLRADPGGPAIVPQILCVLTIVAAGANLVLTIVKQDGARVVAATIRSFFADFKLGVRAEKSEGPRVFVAMLLVCLYPLGITEFGFLLATAALVGLLCWICRLKVLRSVILMILTPTLIYWLFDEIMKARVPEGQIFDILMLL
ncbi:hypothetical protein G5B40_09590 [Pikeienuella piscinae]|uniref:DUF1468 domain-containing protein n=1 Tax=Pikeienuella piscinae TaxID=2748098 RepID=A0A7L5BZI4_9RHOB|nr:tripartite tricarboxylate transporter TctB family protein [Pikeienuella piscinae]QIE55676.1 hypothetical protein G5B40_09590 [Pikeienuella piscinae]